MFIEPKAIIEFHSSYVENRHLDDGWRPETAGLLSRIELNHAKNFDLWHVEDEARRRDLPDSYIADCKRRIDQLNQERNNAIEAMDEAIIEALPHTVSPESEGLPMNSETPGSIIDRLSIISLKIFHMREESGRKDAPEEQRIRCSERLGILSLQRDDLGGALGALLDDLVGGRKRLRVYRQFKMYNDPNLNPSLYRSNPDG